MKISKSDLSNLIGTLRHDIPQKNQQMKEGRSEGSSKKANSNSIHLDNLRNKAMYLNSKISDWQTYLTTQQMQLSFLNKLKNNENWMSQLTVFLGDDSKIDLPEKDARGDIGLYQDGLKLNINKARQELSRGQVELQNLFASGLISEPEVTNFKNMKEMSQAFKPFKVETIRNLLQ